MALFIPPEANTLRLGAFTSPLELLCQNSDNAAPELVFATEHPGNERAHLGQSFAAIGSTGQ